MAQATLILPDTPDLHAVQKAWRGHNLAATALLDWTNHPDFRDVLPALHGGVFRWPFGNRANNYDWQAGLSNQGVLNLKEAAAFSKETGMDIQMVVNFGNGSAADAGDLVRFCNSEDAAFAALRQQLLGAADPLNVNIWEIGNEINTAWGFGWSWLGFQEKIFFRTGQPPVNFSEEVADSLYFYGGSLWRAGWVKKIGGLTQKTAILGDIAAVNAPTSSVAVAVDYPELDTTDPSAVRVWLTPGFDFAWAGSASQQALYDSLTQPWNLLPLEDFDWDATTVTIAPPSGISSQSVLLIEYNSIHHDGAFAFLDAMKVADPAIQAGFCTAVKPALATNPSFQQDFAAHTPDFMIEHPYATGLTKPAVESGLFSEMAWVPAFKTSKFVEKQQVWNQRLNDWNLPHPVGTAYTEWNVALCDECPNPHPFDGIAGALYTASFRANLLQTAATGDVDIRAVNHFAMLASGNNFIHLFHVNNGNFTIGNEGMAALLCMAALGQQMFANFEVQNMPQLMLDAGQGMTIQADALEIFGGYAAEEEAVKLLIINRNDEQPEDVQVVIPPSWAVDSVHVTSLTGTMTDDGMETLSNDYLPVAGVVDFELPRFSVSVITFPQEAVTGLAPEPERAVLKTGTVWQDEHTLRLELEAKNPVLLTWVAADVSGRKVKDGRFQLLPGRNELSISVDGFPAGALFVHLSTASGWSKTLKVLKK